MAGEEGEGGVADHPDHLTVAPSGVAYHTGIEFVELSEPVLQAIEHGKAWTVGGVDPKSKAPVKQAARFAAQRKPTIASQSTCRTPPKRVHFARVSSGRARRKPP